MAVPVRDISRMSRFICRRALARPISRSYITSSGPSLSPSLHTSSSPRKLRIQHRSYATTTPPQKPIKTSTRSRSGPFSFPAAILFFLAGAGMLLYFRQEKARLERRRIAEQSKGAGKPKVGGAFDLVDQEGKRFTSDDMRGGFSIVYFGFTHCPDICPEELDKLAQIIDLVNDSSRSEGKVSTSSFIPRSSSTSSTSTLLPIFITCDPARDTPAVLKTYLAEFHPGIVGLTGSWEAIRDICKKYRVYFSTPPHASSTDYLVDHSIYFYLMDPDGDFVEAIGRQHSAETAARIVGGHMGDWKADGAKGRP